MKIDYIIEETKQKEFYKQWNALKQLADETSSTYIFKGANEQ